MTDLVAIDLHVHSALSPCAAEEMKPPAMLLTAERRGLRVLGVVDHSSSRNAWAMAEAAQAFDVRVLVGLEVESAEGVHILTLFDTVPAAAAMDELIAGHLPPACNRPQILGEQYLLDEWGEVVGQDRRLLIAAVDLGLEEIVAAARRWQGLAIPAHIDRSANGLLPTLGFVPPGLGVEVLEVSPHCSLREARRRWPELGLAALSRGSDAHCLAEIGRSCSWVSRDLAAADLPAGEWGHRLADELREEARLKRQA